MTTEIMLGAPRMVSFSRDENGYRTYKITHIVQGFQYADLTWPGPAEVVFTAGLPVPGNFWLVDNDVDLWSWVRLNMEIEPFGWDEGDGPITMWKVTNYVSNKPPDPYSPESQNSPLMCSGGQIEDPLLQPQKVSGSFVKAKREATHDRFNNPIVNGAFEQIRGPQVEFDEDRPTIKIEQNVVLLQADLFTWMVNCVNSAPMWGLPARSVKLANASWSAQYYGLCYKYYTRTFEFEVNVKKNPDNPTELIGAWDKDLMDEATKCLDGFWHTDPDDPLYRYYEIYDDVDKENPGDFVKYRDIHGTPGRCLLWNGIPINSDPDVPKEPNKVHVEYYPGTNFFALGIPTTF